MNQVETTVQYLIGAGMQEKAFEVDANDMVVAFAEMMRRKISMPAHFMYDGFDPNLFQHFSIVASRLGVYTVTDYRQILQG
ncbi:hypothetical protein TIFTF001_044537 [Ficus carica]|uniref:Uncharacterized protein n=1 Tax=Ficus carica TaxID=3494 RepID=A0AA88D9H6_FICCA|nr:hypothetical protein TIFTF001_044537 [Ficus carica]